ncbi:MAG: Isocitrate dehydrogenase [NADP] [Candidatus Marinimicrobia bacterium]|nr:Isocitrate dehydrogenase [NADP] [Candidatus Neomarinimicrobiota bacterium]
MNERQEKKYRAEHVPITVAHGDGIGPEIMEAVLFILQEAGARLDIETIAVGKEVFEQGHASGIAPEAWESIKRTKILLKAPITPPQGGGYKSLNVTIRKSLNLFANVRPCVSYHPFVDTLHPNMDVVIVRENEEDLYAAIEHRQTHEVMPCLKLITIPGSKRVIRYAFEFAKQNNRSRVTCLTKDNIMKLTDGLFHKLFREIAEDYPGIDVFIDWHGVTPEELADKLKQTKTGALKLQIITNRGVEVWPEDMPETFCTDHWRCRFQREDFGAVTHADIVELLKNLSDAGFDFIKTENLYNFDGKPGYSPSRGRVVSTSEIMGRIR